MGENCKFLDLNAAKNRRTREISQQFIKVLPTVSAESHHAPPALAPATEAELPKPGTVSASSSLSALPGRSRVQKRVAWSFDAETSRWLSGRDVSAKTFELCTWESAARGTICGVNAESAGAACDAGAVAAADDSFKAKRQHVPVTRIVVTG